MNRVAAYLALLGRRTRWRNGSGPGCPVQACLAGRGCQAAAARAKIFVPAAGGDVRRDQCSSVAQWQSIRLLTGGLLVRVQPEEPNRSNSISYERSFSGSSLAKDFALFLPFLDLKSLLVLVDSPISPREENAHKSRSGTTDGKMGADGRLTVNASAQTAG
jgi:hypothetical protein